MFLSNVQILGGACLGLVFALLALPAVVCAQQDDSGEKLSLAEINQGPYGYWKHVDEDTGKIVGLFKIWKHKNRLVGKIVKSFSENGKPPQKTCSECEGRRKNAPIVGMTFFWGFTPEEDEPRSWVDGKILNPEDGEVYSATADLSEDGSKLEVYGYVQVIFKIGGTSVWVRPTEAELKGVL